MEFIEISAKNVDDAITQATVQLGITSDQLEYEVLDKGSTGFLGIGSKNAVIKARKKFSIDENVVEFFIFHFRCDEDGGRNSRCSK